LIKFDWTLSERLASVPLYSKGPLLAISGLFATPLTTAGRRLLIFPFLTSGFWGAIYYHPPMLRIALTLALVVILPISVAMATFNEGRML